MAYFPKIDPQTPPWMTEQLNAIFQTLNDHESAIKIVNSKLIKGLAPTPVAPQPQPDLSNEGTVAPPSGVTLTFDPSSAVLQDGTTLSRANVTWTASGDPAMLNGGHYEVQYQFNTVTTAQNGGTRPDEPGFLSPTSNSDGSYTSAWIAAGMVSASMTSVFIPGISLSMYQTMVAEVRALRANGVFSTWASSPVASMPVVAPKFPIKPQPVGPAPVIGGLWPIFQFSDTGTALDQLEPATAGAVKVLNVPPDTALITTGSVTAGAITNTTSAQDTSTGNAISAANAEQEAYSVTVNNAGGTIGVFAATTVANTGSNTNQVTIRVRKDSLNGTVLQTALQAAVAEKGVDVSIIAVDTSPAASQVYILTIECDSTTPTYGLSSIIALNLLR